MDQTDTPAKVASNDQLGPLVPERDPVAWIDDWMYEHLVSGDAHKGPAMIWPDPRDLSGLVPLFDRAAVDAAVAAERERWRSAALTAATMAQEDGDAVAAQTLRDLVQLCDGTNVRVQAPTDGAQRP